jgi:16S rRNA (guanine966-N2)-methyltransferase
MRVTAGKYKNKRIATKLKGSEAKYRPTAERTRMAVFNMLVHSSTVDERILDGAVVADICAGCGSFGIESLSRGAARVYFIDKDPAQIRLIRHNIASLAEEVNSVFVSADATKLVPMPDKFNIVYIDPPYILNIASEVLSSVAKNVMLDERHIIIIEANLREVMVFPPNFTVLDQREYGRTKVIFGKFS